MHPTTWTNWNSGVSDGCCLIKRFSAARRFASHAATQGLQNLHLLDGRLPHALVAELFTDAGVGTLLTRQLAGAPTS